MSLLRIILATLLIQGATPLPPPQPQVGSIEGIVVGSTGDALSKVTVTLSLPPGVSMPKVLTFTTGADGRFAFSNVRPGTYRVSADRNGYVPIGNYGETGSSSLAPIIVLPPGQTVKNVSLSMTMEGSVSGRIADRNGTPLARALVQAWKFAYSVSGRGLTVVQSVTTDDLGNYRLFWLPPGSYLVTATPISAQRNEGSPVILHSDGSRTPNTLSAALIASALGQSTGEIVSNRVGVDGSIEEEAWTPFFYPGVASVTEAAPVDVRAGSATPGIDMMVSPVRVQRIRGVTIDGSTGRPASMDVVLIPKTNGVNPSDLVRHVRSSENGAFELTGVVPGSYVIWGGLESPWKSTVPVIVDKTDLNNLRLTTTPGFAIKTQIHLDGIAADSIRNLDTRIQLAPVNFPYSTIYATMVDGTLTFPNVPAGDYRVAVDGGATLLKSVHLGNQDGLSDVLRIQSQPEAPLDIVLGDSHGNLDIRVVNDRREQVRSAVVVLVPDPPYRQQTARYATATDDGSGKFKIRAAPGSYKVFAWERVEYDAWFDADFMRRDESRGRPVIITDGSSEAIDVSVIPSVP